MLDPTPHLAVVSGPPSQSRLPLAQAAELFGGVAIGIVVTVGLVLLYTQLSGKTSASVLGQFSAGGSDRSESSDADRRQMDDPDVDTNDSGSADAEDAASRAKTSFDQNGGSEAAHSDGVTQLVATLYDEVGATDRNSDSAPKQQLSELIQLAESNKLSSATKTRARRNDHTERELEPLRTRIDDLYETLVAPAPANTPAEKLDAIEDAVGDGADAPHSDLREVVEHLEEERQVPSDIDREDNQLITGMLVLEDRPETARRNLSMAVERVDEYEATVSALRSVGGRRFGDGQPSSLNTDELETVESKLDRLETDAGLASEVRTLVEQLRSCEGTRSELETEIAELEGEIRDLEQEREGTESSIDHLQQLADRIEREMDLESVSEDSPTTQSEQKGIAWAAPIERLVEAIAAGRVGHRHVAPVAEQLRAETTAPTSVETMLERIAEPERHDNSAIESAITDVISDVKRYDTIVGGGAKNVDIESVKSTANRVQDGIPETVSKPLETALVEHIESRKTEVDRLSERNVMTRYAIYQELVGLEELLNGLDQSGTSLSADIRAAATEVETAIDRLRQRRQEQQRFGRANDLVDHYINLAEGLYDDGVEAMENGRETEARERFDAADRTVEFTHEMYEGDRKKLLARAAGIAE